MSSNDPSDYRVPVLRLSDFFEEEGHKKDGSVYGDSAVTGFDWSTAPAATSADPIRRSGDGPSTMRTDTEDELPEHPASLTTPSLSRDPIVPRRSPTTASNAQPGDPSREPIDVGVQSHTVRVATRAEETFRTTPISRASEHRAQTPEHDTVPPAPSNQQQPQPVEIAPTDSTERAASAPTHTTDLTPKRDVLTDELSEVQKKHLAREEPIDPSSNDPLIEPGPAGVGFDSKPDRPDSPVVPNPDKPLNASKPVADVWGAFEKKMYPGLVRDHVQSVPRNTGQTTPAMRADANPPTSRGPLDDHETGGRAMRNAQMPPNATGSVDTAQRTSMPMVTQDTPDIWDTPHTALQDIVLRHAPGKTGPIQDVDGMMDGDLVNAANMRDDTSRADPTAPSPSETQWSTNESTEYEMYPNQAPAQTAQQIVPTNTTRTGEVAQTDVQSLQHYLGMLDTVPDLEENEQPAMALPVKQIRTLQSDIRDGTAFTQNISPENHTRDGSSSRPRERALADVEDLPSPMRTFKRDVEREIQQRGPSILQTVTMQEDAREVSDLHIPGVSKRISPGMFILLGTAIILVLSSIGIGTWLYFSSSNKDAVKTSTSIPENESTIPYNIERKTRSQLMRDLVEIRDSLKRDKGVVVRIVLFTETVVAEGQQASQIPIESNTFFDRIDSQAPDELTRNVTGGFVLGLITVQKSVPFLLLRSSAEDKTFEGMREWESSMQRDLSPLFSLTPSEHAGETQDTRDLAFEDAMVANNKVRTKKNADRTILTWMQSGGYIIVTENEEALATLWERVRVGSLSLADE